ncbi:serine hydrolase domain-containing protein [Flavivirga aquatica]|uniref:serine hydrolase domain-containing protein n=1 Tax=Flavivirga aquatica TaxID=1849968 RepID=UPI0009F1642F|nr:serine hydrolase domain-containing protein [Flavivirga aquatica]
MKTITLGLLLSLCLINIGCSQEKSKIANPTQLESKVDALVKQYQDLDIFSGVVLVAEKGEPKYYKAFGMANREENKPNTLTTKFDIGSMNKSFTKTLILQLMEEGKLKVTDKLGVYLKGFPETAATKITILDLLKHRSGYGGYWGRDFNNLPIDQKRIPALVERIKKLPLDFEPGTETQYSNAGYVLLGAIVQEVTGNTYHKEIQERILNPLGMTETYVVDKSEVPDRAIGYLKDMKGNITSNTGFVEVPNPDGGFQSSAGDIVKFYTEYFYGDTLLTKTTKMDEMFFKFNNENRTTGGAIPMAGGFPGANTAYYEVLRDEISIIVFANMDEPVAEQLGSGILVIVRGKEPITPSLPAIQNIYNHYKKYGLQYIEDNFYNLIENFHAEDPKGIILNDIGYDFLQNGEVDEALKFFHLNIKMFPEDANLWDSLGEGYYEKGDYKKSLQYYKKALEMQPGMSSAIDMVAKLELKK